jgi:hypothetical protein
MHRPKVLSQLPSSRPEVLADATTARERDVAGQQRDAAAQARDRAADRLDANAQDRDALSDRLTRAAPAHADGDHFERAQRDRERATEDRACAAADRALAAENRERAAADRVLSARDREAAVAEQRRAAADAAPRLSRDPAIAEIQRELERAQRTGSALTVVVIEVRGRLTGELPRMLAGGPADVVSVVLSRLRSYDLVVGIGDELVAAACGVPIDRAAARFGAVAQELATAGITISVGYAELRPGDTLATLVERAAAECLTKPVAGDPAAGSASYPGHLVALPGASREVELSDHQSGSPDVPPAC